jgi:transcriptional regulator with PAS, ATPase and Fis domain
VRFYEPTDGAVVCELEYAAYLAAHRIEFLAGGGGGSRTGEARGEGRSVVIEELIGESELIREVRKNILIAAGIDLSVLIIGEPGTGKELVARGIHRASGRANGPFVDVNCAAFNPNLIESELFGHEKGAFTGALARKPGRFERANGETLFLDEIGDLPHQSQAMLLRVLQERKLERVGGTEAIKVDIRLIAATNHDLHLTISIVKSRRGASAAICMIACANTPSGRRRSENVQLIYRYLSGAISHQSNSKKKPWNCSVTIVGRGMCAS